MRRVQLQASSKRRCTSPASTAGHAHDREPVTISMSYPTVTRTGVHGMQIHGSIFPQGDGWLAPRLDQQNADDRYALTFEDDQGSGYVTLHNLTLLDLGKLAELGRITRRASRSGSPPPVL